MVFITNKNNESECFQSGATDKWILGAAIIKDGYSHIVTGTSSGLVSTSHIS